MVNAICTELVLRKSEIKEPLETIYFGGGTPSVLSKLQLEKIFKVIHDSYLIKDDVEITLEANPDDLLEEKLKELKEAGMLVESTTNSNEVLQFKVGNHLFVGKVTKVKKLEK
jgi:oxygen-independent coproporphyrinogen-3 oxidase